MKTGEFHLALRSGIWDGGDASFIVPLLMPVVFLLDSDALPVQLDPQDDDSSLCKPSPWEKLEDRGDDDDDHHHHEDDAASEEEEDEDQAANILTSVLPDIKKAGNLPNGEYEDLLDCLASLASRQLPLEPLSKTVSRLSVDDIGVKPSNKTSPSLDDEDERPRTRRPRALSNPEGCDIWKAYENGITARNTTDADVGTRSPTLPHMLAKYANVYNRNGRIGIYTREERDAIIARFREKRSRRVWAKKIRYSCRKNLADKRTRVKGLFVKITEDEPQNDNGMDVTPTGTDDSTPPASTTSSTSGVGRKMHVMRAIDESAPSDNHDDDDDVRRWDDDDIPHKRMRRHSIC